MSTGFGIVGHDANVPSNASPVPASSAVAWAKTFQTVPTTFVQNKGQISNSAVTLYATSGDVRVGFETGAVLVIPVIREVGPQGAQVDIENPAGERRGSSGVLVRLAFEGANPVEPVGRDELPHRSHFFLGSDPSKWVRDVRSYREVVYEDLYDGIDLVYRLAPGGLKYEFHVRPGADPGRIAMRYEGTEELRIEGGDLVVETAAGLLRDERPVGFTRGRSVECAFVSRSPDTVGVECGGRDPSEPLVIDPLLYSTYLGGAPAADEGVGIAVGESGDIYVTGFTASDDFPTTPGAFDQQHNRLAWDAFVARISPDGSGGADLVYSTFLGGEKDEVGRAIVVDAGGNAYVTGFTTSPDFPTTPGAYDQTCGTDGNCDSPSGIADAFVTKLNADGSALVYSTFLGGNNVDDGHGLRIDTGLNAYVAGKTLSPDFPTTLGAYDRDCGTDGVCDGGRSDAFVAKLNDGGSAVLYATFLGGGDDDAASSLDIDSLQDVRVAGNTRSDDFPVTPGAFDTGLGGLRDGFVARLRLSGGGIDDLQASTYLGGVADEILYSVVVDSSGNAVVTGETWSWDFPTTSGGFQTATGGSGDAFVTKLDDFFRFPLLYSTYLGGASEDVGWAVDMDGNGDVYVTGGTGSDDFPTTPGATDPTPNGGFDAFVTMLHPAGLGAKDLLSSTFLGGSGVDVGQSLVADTLRRPYVVGWTGSTNFPTTSGAYDESYNGFIDVFVTQLLLNARPVVTAQISASTVPEGSSFTVNGTFYDPDWSDTHTVEWDFGYYDDMRDEGPTVPGDPPWPPPGPGNTTHTVPDRDWIYGDDGSYTIRLSVADNFEEVGSDDISVVVTNVAPTLISVTAILHENGPLTHGYWKHQYPCNPNTEISEEHPGIRQEWVDAIRQQSLVFTDVYAPQDVCAYLDPPTPMTNMKMAKVQMMALWLNVVSDRLWIDSPLHHPDAPGDETVREFIAHAEASILAGTNLEWVITIATAINEDADDGETPDWQYVDPLVGEYRAHALDPGTDDLTFIWRIDPGDGNPEYDVTHVQYNSGGPPEPDYDAAVNEVRTPGGTYPFEVVNLLVVGYPPGAGTGVSARVRCLQDDDGGVSDDASDCSPPVPPIATVDWSFSFTVTYHTISGGFRVATVAATFTAYDPEVVPVIVSAGFP